MISQEAGAALDSALLSSFTAGAAGTESGVSPPLPYAITCALRSARGTVGAKEGRAAFTIRIVGADEDPSDRRRSEKENDTALRGSAIAACGAFNGIEDLLGFSPRNSVNGSSLPSPRTTTTHGSDGLSSALGGDLLGSRAGGVDHPSDESWSSAEEPQEADSAEGVKKSRDTASALSQTLPISAAENTAPTISAQADETNANAPGTADRGEKAIPLSDTPVAATTGGPAGAVAGDDDKATGGGLADARASSPGFVSSSPLHCELPLHNGSVADSSCYSNDGFDNEDDGGSEEVARASVTPSFFSFSSASSASSSEHDLEDDYGGDGDGGNANGDEARRALQHKRDEMAVSSAAVRLRRRLLRAMERCGGGGGGGEDARAGATLLFDRLDEVWVEFKSFLENSSQYERIRVILEPSVSKDELNTNQFVFASRTWIVPRNL